MEVRDDEIVKALEWCDQFENNIVFKGNGDERCVQALQRMVVIKHALKEYNRQKAEIEELRETIQRGEFTSITARREIELWHRENCERIDRLKAENKELRKINESFSCMGMLYSEIKAEARKEFAERLCEGRVGNDPVVIAVKVELAEMERDGNKRTATEVVAEEVFFAERKREENPSTAEAVPLPLGKGGFGAEGFSDWEELSGDDGQLPF